MLGLRKAHTVLPENSPVRKFVESGKLTKGFNWISSKKTLDCKLHFILAVAASGLIVSGVNDSESHGWRVALGELGRGSMSV